MILAAAVLAQALPGAAAPPPADPCATVCDAAKLKPFFDKLARIRADGRTVRILQIGDSHTAGDQITGAWRTALQARYGNAGRGVLAPGRPYQGYLTKDVTAQQGPGWTVSGIFGATYSAADPTPRGLAHFSLTSTAEGATLSIAADRGTFDRFTVCALTGPGAGTLTLTAGPVARAVPLVADRAGTHCEQVDATGVGAASLVASGGPVTVTSWAVERSAPGVELSNLGTVGAQLVHFGRADERVIAAEAAQYRPDLLVIAFGTNEAFVPGFKVADFAGRLRAGIARLKRLFPDVPMLLLGAPDSATTQVPLQSGEAGASPPCGPPDALLRDWRPTAALASVQATQRRVAHEEGLAFWDWGARMGGRCTTLGWVPTGLMRPDHVHFTTAGGAEIARRLQADLDAAAFAVGAGR